jgi:hypothetical protein
MVIKRHGNRFAGRLLGPAASARIDGNALVVEPGEARFGAVTVSTPQAAAWAETINRLQPASHA